MEQRGPNYGRRHTDVERDEITEVIRQLAALNERAAHIHEQQDIHGKIIYKLKERQVEACANLDQMKEELRKHMEEEEKKEAEIEKFMKEVERLKNKGLGMVLALSVVGALILEGVIEYFKNGGSH